MAHRKTDALAQFNALCEGTGGPSPERLLLEVSHGATQYTPLQIEAAARLLPYRLPKLSAIQTQVEIMPEHESFIQRCAGELDEA